MLNCIDNTGAALVECAMVLGQKRHARIGESLASLTFRVQVQLPRRARQHPLTNAPGDKIVVVVQKHRTDMTSSPGSGSSGGVNAGNRVKRGDIRHAVVVRTRYGCRQRRDGSSVSFGDNACVLLNKSGDPIGTRVNGVVGAELAKKKWGKILSMATMHI